MRPWSSFLPSAILGLLLALPLSFLGCPSPTSSPDGGLSDLPASIPWSSTRLLWETSEQRPLLPFPSDFFTQADPSRPTGLRLDLGAKTTVAIDRGLQLFGDIYPKLLSQNDGWSAVGSIFLLLSGPIPTDDLPDDHEKAASSSSSRFFLIRHPSDPSASSERVPLIVRFESLPDADGQILHLLRLRPLRPLQSRQRYLVAITTDFKDKEGLPLAPSPTFLALRDGSPLPAETPHKAKLEALREPLTSGLQRLSKSFQIQPSSVTLAFPLTIGSTVQDILAARDALEASAAFASPKPDLIDPKTQALRIYPSPRDVPRASPKTKTDHILAVIAGSFSSPDFRNDAKHWVFEQGRPVIQKESKVPFLLVLPKAIEAGPVPIVISQHGLSSSKELMLKSASALAEKGIAVAMMDAVAHGDRAKNPANAVLEFLQITDGTQMLDNFRQTIVDHLQFQRLIQGFSKLDLIPLGQPDGKPDFITDKIGYMGHSLGGIFGGMLLSLLPQRAYLISASGGRFEDILQGILGSFLPSESRLLSLQTTLAIQTLLDRTDPLNGLALLPASSSLQVLLQQGMADKTMPAAATESLALTLQTPLLQPFALPIPGLPIVASPHDRIGLFQYPDVDHDFPLREDYPPTTLRTQAQAAHFFASFFQHTSAQIIAP